MISNQSPSKIDTHTLKVALVNFRKKKYLLHEDLVYKSRAHFVPKYIKNCPFAKNEHYNKIY